MKGMGPVERVLVLGIVVVIVAILGIAVWGAAGDDADATDGLARDGGVMVDAGRPEAGTPLGAFARDDLSQDPLANASGTATPPAPGNEAAWLKQLSADEANRRLTQAEGAGGATPTDGGGVASPGLLGPPAPVGGEPAGSVALNHVEPLDQQPAAAAPAVANAPEAVAPTAKKPAAKKVESGIHGGTTHVVVAGDSLWKIAHRTYGDSDVREHIDAMLAENPSLDEDEPLLLGTKIKLPAIDVKGDVVRLPADKAAAQIDGRTYKVKAGDTLSTIAQRELGGASRWQEIYDLNRARLTDPAKIVEGMTLTLPSRN